MCGLCSGAGFIGGYIGGYFGINPPASRSGRFASAVITSVITAVNVIALKRIFGQSICNGQGTFTAANLARTGAITLVLGIVYSIAVNYIISRYNNSPPPQSPPAASTAKKPCCCSKKPDAPSDVSK
jgi:hypothetical protein